MHKSVDSRRIDVTGLLWKEKYVLQSNTTLDTTKHISNLLLLLETNREGEGILN